MTPGPGANRPKEFPAMNTATKLQAMPTAEIVEPKETALAVIPEAKVEAIFLKGEGINELLDACEKKATAVTTDASTAKGRAEIKSMAYLVARTKTAFDAPGKALSAEYKEKPKIIDGHRKKVADYLEDLQKRVRKPLTDWEEAEKDRVRQLQARVDSFKATAEAVAATAAEIMGWIEHVQKVEIDDSFGELKGAAAIAKDAALTRLRERHAAAVNQEAEARERQEREKKELAERLEREAQEKFAREKLELENQLLREKARREQAERDAEDRAKQAVEDERRRKESEDAAAQAKATALQADEDNRWRVHSEILEDLESAGLTEVQARDMLTALMNGEIRNVEITY